MFGIGMPELLVILSLALLVFGAKSLPEIGSGLDKAIWGFKEVAGQGSKPSLASARLASQGCRQCGAGRPSAAAFCPHCGTKLQAS